MTEKNTTVGKIEQLSNYCECHRCIKEKWITVDFPGLGKIPLSSRKMIICVDCGNKRCPKANDHNLKCTGSNEPGQPGSAYT